MPRSLKERLLEKVCWSACAAGHTCWEWTGVRTGKYRRAACGKEGRTKAARAVYEEFIGAIPPGMLVLHDCDNPGCVNPAHLYVGTHGDNMSDRWARKRGRSRRGLTAEQVREIRRLLSSGAGQSAAARAIGCYQGQVAHIQHGRAYREVS